MLTCSDEDKTDSKADTGVAAQPKECPGGESDYKEALEGRLDEIMGLLNELRGAPISAREREGAPNNNAEIEQHNDIEREPPPKAASTPVEGAPADSGRGAGGRVLTPHGVYPVGWCTLCRLA